MWLPERFATLNTYARRDKHGHNFICSCIAVTTKAPGIPNWQRVFLPFFEPIPCTLRSSVTDRRGTLPPDDKRLECWFGFWDCSTSTKAEWYLVATISEMNMAFLLYFKSRALQPQAWSLPSCWTHCQGCQTIMGRTATLARHIPRLSSRTLKATLKRGLSCRRRDGPTHGSSMAPNASNLNTDDQS